MNINALRDADSDPGFYAAVSATSKVWPGAIIYQSLDGGATYQQIASSNVRAAMGLTLNTLGSYSGGNTVDELNLLNVRLSYGSLSSVPYSGLLQGAQAALIGDEVVYFRSARLNADRSYTISGLLRGRRGTEHAMAGHAPGERFILLTPNAIKRIPQATADIGMTRLYKAVTSGLAQSTATAQSFTNTGAALKPYAPVHLGGGRLPDGACLITWVRRGRLSGEWRDYVDVPVSEEIERYDIEICAPGFTSVVRAVSVQGASEYEYSAADQAADFGSLQAALYVRIYQISAVVGRGYPAAAII